MAQVKFNDFQKGIIDTIGTDSNTLHSDGAENGYMDNVVPVTDWATLIQPINPPDKLDDSFKVPASLLVKYLAKAQIGVKQENFSTPISFTDINNYSTILTLTIPTDKRKDFVSTAIINASFTVSCNQASKVFQFRVTNSSGSQSAVFSTYCLNANDYYTGSVSLVFDLPANETSIILEGKNTLPGVTFTMNSYSYATLTATY
jgi:hypothetical protein